MEVLYPLCEVLPAMRAPWRARPAQAPQSKAQSKAVRVRRELPLLHAACARIVSVDEQPTTHMTVPATHAEMVDTLVALADGGDLSAEAWADVDAVALITAANFFQVPDVRRMVELAHHRTSVARASPLIAQAIATDAAARAAIKRGDSAGGELREIPLGTRTPRVTPQPPADVPRFIKALQIRQPHRDAVAWASQDEVIRALKNNHVYDILAEHSDHVVAAGGFVASTLLKKTTDPVADQDVDLFVWGCDADDANDIVEHIHNVLREIPGAEVTLLATEQAFTFRVKRESPTGATATTIQVVRRIYASFHEIPLGFDIPASAAILRVVVDDEDDDDDNEGHLVAVAHGTASFFAAADTNAVWIDPERQSASYAWRILKYWARGFNVFLFGMHRRIANLDVLGAPLKELRGLSEILAIEHLAVSRNLHRLNHSAFRALNLVSIVRRGLPR